MVRNTTDSDLPNRLEISANVAMSFSIASRAMTARAFANWRALLEETNSSGEISRCRQCCSMSDSKGATVQDAVSGSEDGEFSG